MDPDTANAFVSPGALSGESTFDEYAANPRFRQLQTELRSWLFVGANSRDHSPEPGVTPQEEEEEEEGQNLSASHRPGHEYLWEHMVNGGASQIPPSKKILYLQVWITDCAPWLDMFDGERHFGQQVPIIARRSTAVLHAMLAVGARTAERQGRMERSGSRDSLELYSQAITSLTSSLDTREPTVVLTACLLCVLEMMSVSPRDWRRHVEGCAALFASFGINGFSGGLLQAVFWCYARMDLCGAIIADGTEATVLEIEKWILLDDFTGSGAAKAEEIKRRFSLKGQQVPDMYANFAVYLCARVCDLLFRRIKCVEMGEDNGCEHENLESEWTRLWNDLQEWLSRRPVEMLPVKTVRGGAFPRIFFSHWAAISGNQLFHTACILMLEIKGIQELDRPEQVYSPLWHARRVVGITLTNPHCGCINNAIQPLYVAGQLFTHREEQAIIVKLIDSIETRTGWGSRWRIKDLEAIWGYHRGTFT